MRRLLRDVVHNVVIGITPQPGVVRAEELVIAGALHEVGGPGKPEQVPLAGHIRDSDALAIRAPVPIRNLDGIHP